MADGIEVVMIAAVAANGVIGQGNRLIWRLPTDLKRFRALTLGRPIVMGRKTFLSLGKPLDGRTNIVVTRDAGFSVPDVVVVGSLAEGLAAGREIARRDGVGEVIVGGGGEIYAQALAVADRIELTEVDLAPVGDTHFPALPPADWIETARERPERGSRDDADFAFVTLRRR